MFSCIDEVATQLPLVNLSRFGFGTPLSQQTKKQVVLFHLFVFLNSDKLYMTVATDNIYFFGCSDIEKSLSV